VEVYSVKIYELRDGELPYLKVEGITNFDIGKIFDCGQCFRFDAVENSPHEKEFSGVAYGRLVSFAQDGDTLFIYGSDARDFEDIWKRYLDIERDYDAVGADILSKCDNEALSEAVEYGRGIRILAQDPFECVISFIISQNNNIPRIKKIIETLSKRCGASIKVPKEMQKHLSQSCSLCAFPTAEALYSLGVEGLFDLKTGFRAKYIYDAVERMLDGRLSIESVIEELDTEVAIEKLCSVKGIGRKVASCALLFGFGKYDAFPIDVWMKKVAKKYFGEEGEALNAESFGRYAGIAQQYLFYYERYRSI
jgi:N-glycosylase/DNA lyase